MQRQNDFRNINYEYKKADTFATYNQYDAIQQIERQNLEKYEKFKARIKQFEDVTTIEEAKQLASKILPIEGNRCSFRVGNAKCVIINTNDLFRISVDTVEEFISYDFAQ